MFQRPFRFCLLVWKGPVSNRASDISRKKSKISRDFFRGKFAEKSADFAGFSRGKSQNSWRNGPISRNFRGKKVKLGGTISRFRGILAEKRQFSKDFQGQILRKIGRFHGKFWGGNFAKKQSVKNSRFRWIFFRKFRYDDMTLVNVSFNRNNHLLFQQQFAREMSECYSY